MVEVERWMKEWKPLTTGNYESQTTPLTLLNMPEITEVQVFQKAFEVNKSMEKTLISG